MANIVAFLEGLWLHALDVAARPHFLAGTLLTVSAVLAGLGFGYLLRAYFGRVARCAVFNHVHVHQLARRFSGALTPLLTLILLRVFLVFFQKAGYPIWPFHNIVTLCQAWLAASVIMALVSEVFLAKCIAVVVWCVAGLEVLGLLEPTYQALHQIGFQLDNQTVSLLTALEGAFALALLLPAANLFSNFLEAHIEKSTRISPRAQILIVKSIKAVLFVVVILSALNIVGLSIHALTVFSGALGLGLGFGLQKVVSNLVSGVVLLLDNAIRPGDVIEVDGVYGWIQTLNARYVSMLTRDGTSYLIPNDDLMTRQVINWSHSGREVRLKVSVSVGYASDLRQAMNLMRQAALSFDRVVESPPPAARLLAFGESGVDLQLRFWIRDPQCGVVNIKSDIMLAIWDLFREHGIEFPFPQREVRLRGGLEGLAANWRGASREPGEEPGDR